MLGGRKIFRVRRQLVVAARESPLRQDHKRMEFPQAMGRSDHQTVQGDLRCVPSSVAAVSGKAAHGMVEVEHVDDNSQNLDGSFSLLFWPTNVGPTMPPASSRTETSFNHRQSSALPIPSAQWRYISFAFLCTLGLFVTWIPISINRVYNTFVSPSHQIYGMYLASSICIPLHGFANFLVYIAIHWTEFRQSMRRVWFHSRVT